MGHYGAPLVTNERHEPAHEVVIQFHFLCAAILLHAPTHQLLPAVGTDAVPGTYLLNVLSPFPQVRPIASQTALRQAVMII